MKNQQWEFYEMTDAAIDPNGEEALALFHVQRAIESLKKAGVSVKRYEFLQQPAAFLQNEQVAELMEEEGDAAFPLLLVDGHLKKSSAYPAREEWAAWSGLPVETFPETFPEVEVEMWRYFLSLSQQGACGDCSSCGGSCGCGSRDPEDLLEDVVE